MEKLKNATKRIAAVATTVVMLSSAASAAGLGDYPNNFVQDGKFNGQVVVGSTAAAIDSASAATIIADLASEFSGDSDKVKITYKNAATGGDSINAVRSNNELNYGENLGDVTETAGFDDTDADVLADGRFTNGVSDEDYQQTIVLANGAFNYALRDNVDNVNEIKNGLYYADGDTFANYTLTMDNGISLASLNTADFKGETLNIMGNEFTISDISASTGGALTKLELLGGSNKVSLGEGETQTVTVDGKSYEIEVQSVSANKVLLSVNGETKSIDNLDTEEIAGINVVVTDLVESSRDSVKGYAEVVIGGQKITLEDNKLVQINDDDVDEVYPDYEVYAYFSGSGLDTITLSYKVSDDVLLAKGDSLDDVLFQTFSLVYDGTNEPDYTNVDVKVNDDDLDIKGTTENGEDLTLSMHNAGTADDGSDGNVYLKGHGDEDRVFHAGSDLTLTSAADGVFTQVTDISTTVANDVFTIDSTNYTAGTNFTVNANDTITAQNIVTELVADGLNAFSEGANVYTQSPVTGNYSSTADSVTFALTKTGVKGSGITILRDSEEQYLYQITSVDTSDVKHEVDFDELLRGDDESNIQRTQWDTKLGTDITTTAGTDIVTVPKNQLGHMVAFENNVALMLNTPNMENTSINLSGTNTLDLVFALDNADVDADNTPEEKDAVKVAYGWDIQDNEFDIKDIIYTKASGDIQDTAVNFTDGNFVNKGLADNEDGNSDVQTFVTKYGIKAEYDNNEGRSVKIMVPKEQVNADVSLVFGGEVASTQTITFDSEAAADAWVEAHPDMIVTDRETITNKAVQFDIASAVVDTEVTGTSDMIVVGGPAVNAVARELMGITSYTVDQAGVEPGKGVIRYFEDSNSVLVYGYTGDNTAAAVSKLNDGSLTGTSVDVE